ncbi:MAG: dual specificity protein phosphatase 23 [Planctomycetota bacterium]|jgi:atypical dual specificity phosphatase
MIRNFSWLIEGEIAGMAKPASTVSDFEFLKDNNIDAIVSLSEFPLDQNLVEEFGFEVKHIPVRDFESPRMEQVEDFLKFAKEIRTNGKKLVVHCDAGAGRTGTMLACYLVSKGYDAAKAIEEVRRKRPGSIETPGQEEVVVRCEGKIERI